MQKFLVKTAVAASVGFLALQIAMPVFALKVDERSEVAGSRPGLLRNFSRGNGRAAIGTGTVTAKTPSVPGTLTITKDGKTYTVNVDTKTQLRRRFWGKATWEEISIGDMVNVIGRWTDDSHTAINAVLVRDLSIQKKFGVFFGTVTANSGSTLMINTKRGTETVTTNTSTKFVNRKEETIAKSDIKVGDKVRVRGLWDSKLNTITEVSKIKDYSLPAK